MPVVGMRELSRNPHLVVEQLEESAEPLVITRHGKPIAVLSSVSEEQAAPLAFAVSPQLIEDRERAAKEIEAGEGELASSLVAEFEDEDEKQAESEADKIEIPRSLIEQVLVTATESQPLSARERTFLNEYVGVLAEGSILSVLERVRNVNANILSEVGGEPAEEQEGAYVSRVRELAVAERLGHPPVEVK